MNKCTLPPRGWKCTRESGHEGPCAAVRDFMQYCLGFAFSQDRERVLLINKTKPENQKDRLNGVGGKVEESELPIAAMVREFWEETHLSTVSKDWMYCGLMSSPRWKISVYSTVLQINTTPFSPTEEILEFKRLDELWKDKRLMFNLNWMIPMCLDPELEPFVIQHK